MCLAVPAKIVERQGDDATVDLQGNRLRISVLLTPEVGLGDWVLVHAGFAITQLDEREARETWEYLREAFGDEVQQELAPDAEAPEAAAGGGGAAG